MRADPELVRAAIERDDAAGVRDLLRHATEAERRACRQALGLLLDGPDDGGPYPEGWLGLARRLAFQAAAFGLAPGAVPAGRHAYLLSRILSTAEFEVLAQVLDDRRPPWLASFVDQRLAGRNVGPGAWVIARRLVTLGAIERPVIPEYTTGMVMALRRYAWDGEGGRTFTHLNPADGLLADPGLLEDEVWRLFTTPGVTRGLAPGTPRHPGWEDALASLSEQGRLDRGRLLDACLDAFSQGFAPDELGWYVAFHDRMSPALDEMAARADRYIRLLTIGAKAAIMLGQKACARLLAIGRLRAEDFLAASGPALLFPQKSVAAGQLKLIGKLAAAQPPVRDRALAAAAEAFGHQRLDIQDAALDLIARYGLPEGPEREVIRERAGRLAPSLEQRATALGLPARSPARTAERQIEVPRRAEPGPGDPLPPPLEDPGELIRLLTQLMEDASDTLAVERAMAGAVRLCGLPAAERARLAAPLVRRAEQRLWGDDYGPFGGHEITSDIAGLTLAWGCGRMPDIAGARRVWGSEDREAVLRSGQARTMAGILTARIWEASTLAAAGHPVELLAEPEFERGPISPDRLLGRLGSWAGRALPPHDLEIALLRLAPGAGDSFWSGWAGRHPSSLAVAQRAYQEGLARLSFEPLVWRPGRYNGLPAPAALARITTPPGEAARSRCWALLTALGDPMLEFYRDRMHRYFMGSRYHPVVTGWPALCPWQPELVAAHLLRPLSESLTSGSGRAGTAAAAVSCLLPSGHPLGEIGHLAVTTGLASAEPYVRIAAAEVWVQACRDGRLDPALAAGAIVVGVVGGAFKLNRVADGLQHASHDPVAGQRIVQAVLAAAEHLVPAKLANLHLLLEIAARVGAAPGTTLPAAITRLASGKNRSRLAAAAHRLAQGTP
jgi:Family of unknown function (DUF6493)